MREGFVSKHRVAKVYANLFLELVEAVYGSENDNFWQNVTTEKKILMLVKLLPVMNSIE